AGEPGASATGVPAAPKPNFGKAKSCILLYLFGAASQHDTFDPKPDAPIGIRGELQNPIATSLPGTRICELLPRIARICDRTTVARSMNAPYPTRPVPYPMTSAPWESMGISVETSMPFQLNPRDPRHWPYIGSVVDYLDEKQRASGGRKSPR